MSDFSQKLDDLLARAQEMRYLTYHELNNVLPGDITAEQLDVNLERAEDAGIEFIGDAEIPTHPNDPAIEEWDLRESVELQYQRVPEFEHFLRRMLIPVTNSLCSFEDNGQMFDATIIVRGDQALSTWRKLRDNVPEFPYWPLLGRADHEILHAQSLDTRDRWLAWRQQRRENPEEPPPLPDASPEGIRADARLNIEDAAGVPPEPWTWHGCQSVPNDIDPDADLPESHPDLEKLFSDNGPFLCVKESFHPYWPHHPFVRIRLFPTSVPWEVFAYQPYGGWNDAPWPDKVLAMLRHWHEQHGAEIVAMWGDTLEVFVPRPPRTRHTALRLASELSWFGEESPVSTAPKDVDICEYLATQHYWFFWWD